MRDHARNDKNDIRGARSLAWKLFALGALGLLGHAPAHAAEGGLSNFPAGAQTTYAAYLPPPGVTSFFGYALYDASNKVRDDDGNAIPGVKVHFLALAPRLVHTWSTKWAGFDLSSGAVVEGVRLKVEAGDMTDHKTGGTLAGIEPLYLQRTVGEFRFLTGPLIYFPLGGYNEKKLANSTANYHSYAWQLSTTWLPDPDFDASLNLAAEYKQKNHATDYKSGTQGSVTFGVGWRPLTDKRFDFGVSGFYTGQFKDDTIDGDRVPGGGRTRKLALGPKFVYWAAPGTAVVVQWHREMDVHNAADGDLFWVEGAIPISLL